MTEIKEESSHEQETQTDNSEALKQEITELTETLQRLQAEFENYKKRTEKEKAAFLQFAQNQCFSELLPIIDNIERALETTKDDGVKLIYQQLQEIIAKHNIKAIDAVGKKFDPLLHEALLQEESEQEAGTVTQVLQKGYIGGDTVLRAAKVAISKYKIPSTPSA